MSTSDRGFSLVELLVAAALSVLLSLSVAPLWFSLQRMAAEAGDDVTRAGQSRVALTRLERDLRLATTTESESGAVGPVLLATAAQVVLVVRPLVAGPPQLVEWEIVGSALMRRTGPATGSLAQMPSHVLFTDHKTMLEGLGGGSGFLYQVTGGGLVADPGEADCANVRAVVLEGRLPPAGSPAGRGTPLTMWGRLAR